MATASLDAGGAHVGVSDSIKSPSRHYACRSPHAQTTARLHRGISGGTSEASLSDIYPRKGKIDSLVLTICVLAHTGLFIATVDTD